MKFFGLAALSVFAVWSVAVVNIDMAVKRIPNVKIVLGVKLLLLALGLLLLNSYMGTRGAVSSYLNWNFYLLWCAHLAWAVLAGVTLWYSEIWPAGDAKFFILVAAWLPLINPYLKNFPNYISLGLLVNIFVMAALAAVGGFFASGFYQARPADFFKELSGDIKKRFAGLAGGSENNKWAITAYLANMTFLFLLQQIFNTESRHFLSRFLARADIIYFFLFFLWDKIGNVFAGRKWMIAITAGYIIYFFTGYVYFYDRLAAFTLYSLGNVFRFSMLLFFGRFMLEFLMEKKDTVYIGPGELQAGMILSAKTARILKANTSFEGAFDDCFKDGLSEEQVGLLRDWMEKLPLREPKIEMVKGRPFALWIFAGAVFTLLFDKNIVKLLM
ncbi:MAG: hypothetical protein A2270_09530 [Elusimicrobia bacterium RIFOXYA12_FULL_51_18]|nr:MAG: hypothetical protein A2270_09530 [Elusimicrobia bacterium RIFOXYA12_FULL_51_18]OGS32742.1 MAG: hypothetical protein A2218_11845 [Elusimicrobia bacterium RIFOXYA2_FULL_53_38]